MGYEECRDPRCSAYRKGIPHGLTETHRDVLNSLVEMEAGRARLLAAMGRKPRLSEAQANYFSPFSQRAQDEQKDRMLREMGKELRDRDERFQRGADIAVRGAGLVLAMGTITAVVLAFLEMR